MYSVTQSQLPYDQDILIGHRMPYQDAMKLYRTLKVGVTSLFPSSDLPMNANEVPAGCYNDAGAMVSAWPCFVVTNDDGSSDVYTGAFTVDAGAYVGGWN